MHGIGYAVVYRGFHYVLALTPQGTSGQTHPFFRTGGGEGGGGGGSGGGDKTGSFDMAGHHASYKPVKARGGKQEGKIMIMVTGPKVRAPVMNTAHTLHPKEEYV